MSGFVWPGVKRPHFPEPFVGAGQSAGGDSTPGDVAIRNDAPRQGVVFGPMARPPPLTSRWRGCDATRAHVFLFSVSRGDGRRFCVRGWANEANPPLKCGDKKNDLRRSVYVDVRNSWRVSPVGTNSAIHKWAFVLFIIVRLGGSLAAGRPGLPPRTGPTDPKGSRVTGPTLDIPRAPRREDGPRSRAAARGGSASGSGSSRLVLALCRAEVVTLAPPPHPQSVVLLRRRLSALEVGGSAAGALSNAIAFRIDGKKSLWTAPSRSDHVVHFTRNS